MSAVCVARLKKERQKLKKDPNQYFETVPLSNDIRTWHYVLKGPADSDSSEGYYHGVLKFPKDYPYKPPSIMMFTPNGRFEINTKICLSNSEFHPESWSPFWSVSNILTGFVSMMVKESNGIGSMKQSSSHRRRLAQQSLQFNCRNPQFRTLFAEHCALYKQQLSDGRKQRELIGERQSADAQQREQPSVRTADRDKVFDWLVICIVVMVLAYGWKELM